MSVSVFLTGAWRTLEHCMEPIKQNLVSLHPGTRVFCCIEYAGGDRVAKETWLRKELGPAFGCLLWFDPTDPVWLRVRNRSSEHMRKEGLGPEWIDYLAFGSGSMIEYYQMWLCYQAMLSWEERSGTSFDYVVRTRTDVYLCRPLLPWLSWTTDDWMAVWNRLVGLDGPRDAVPRVEAMNSLVRPGPFKVAGSRGTDDLDPLFHSWAELKSYVLTGEYALTYRKNIIYVVRRSLFTSDIAHLGLEYGQVRRPGNPYWFNAESQLECRFNTVGGLSVYDSVGWSEGASLYSYRASNYFDEAGQLKPGLDCLFFLLREPPLRKPFVHGLTG
jgi:hypothetical protein